MSRQHRAGRAPDTPPTPDDDSDDPDVSTMPVADIPVGRRFSDNEDLLRLERDLAADGVTLDNRAIPLSDHPEQHDYDDAAEIRDAIEAEAERRGTNKERIGLLNDLLQQL